MHNGHIKGKRFVAAMSGGVDSSVSAAIFAKNGAEVIGVTLNLIDCSMISEKSRSCCGIEDRRQVQEVCSKLGIAHYFLDVRELFEQKVLKACWEEYASGRTPNPCILCNRHIKFKALSEYAKNIGADGIITGHYAKIATDNIGGVSLRRGSDVQKDQSYFLSLVEPDLLAFARCPVAEMDKASVRGTALELGLPNAGRRESQDVCMGLRGANFAETLRRHFGAEAMPGYIVDDAGRRLARHNGIHNFTIGQRRGFGAAFGRPMFVKQIDAKRGDVILTGDEESLFSNRLVIGDINWLMSGFSKKRLFSAGLQIRYRHVAAEAECEVRGDGRIEAICKEAQRAVTPGQAAVLYDGDRVIAGGIILLIAD